MSACKPWCSLRHEALVPVSKTVGANRIVPSVAIPHPLGDPSKTPEQERRLRRRLLDKALTALTTDIDEQTVFD
jgi:betaine reductase